MTPSRAGCDCFIEEWGSGLKRVNDVLEEYGLGKVAVEDTGFAVRMNVNRSNKPTDKAIGETTKNDQPANVSINDENKVMKTGVSIDGVPLNVPLNVPLTDKLVALVKTIPASTARILPANWESPTRRLTGQSPP